MPSEQDAKQNHSMHAKTAKKSVFISYAWEDGDQGVFRGKVKQMRDWLLGQGVHVVSDFDHANRAPRSGWPSWMQHSIEDAAVVLIVCSPKYKLRYEKRGEEGQGLGASWEGAIITQNLYNGAQRNDKFYPVFVEPFDFQDLPSALQAWWNNHCFPSRQDSILALIQECLAEASASSSLANPISASPITASPITASPSATAKPAPIPAPTPAPIPATIPAPIPVAIPAASPAPSTTSSQSQLSEGLYLLVPNPWGDPVPFPWPRHANGVLQSLPGKALKKYLVKTQAEKDGIFSICSLEFDALGPLASLRLVGEEGEHSLSFRYIPPGDFLMGAPDDEAGSRENERPQHRVTISTGFWLADTACTQGFWQTIMGENPSHFQAQNGGGPQHPVEQVSWHMVQEFLQKLATFLPAQARPSLPTEAEWEYACRAGSTTPFSFGANIHTDQVNYNGNYPYANGKKEKYREQTVAVKALPANPWGLYQMHGNVWEWCADEPAAYESLAVQDPGLAQALQPVLSENLRVLRGGSWSYGARGARSAYRYHLRPGRRDSGIGFRFALRSSRQASGV